jgi:uncharacterized protein YceK
MKNLILVLVASVVLGGCASTGQNWSIYEPYEPVQYRKPLVNSMIDSTVSITRNTAEGAVSIGVLKGLTGILY